MKNKKLDKSKSLKSDKLVKFLLIIITICICIITYQVTEIRKNLESGIKTEKPKKDIIFW